MAKQKYDHDKLLNAINNAEQDAYGSDGDSLLSDDRARALDYYLGRNTNPAPDGRSQVVDRSVYETVQWILPSLTRIFANGDDVVELPPLGPDDVQSAKQEGQYLNHILLDKNPWFQIFNEAAKDAAISKTGYLLVYRDKRRSVSVDKYERQTAEGVALLLQKEGVEVISVDEYIDESAQPQIDPTTGMPIQQMLYDLELRTVTTTPHFCIKPLPPERCKVSHLTESFLLKECPYFEYWDECTISDLREEGFKVDDDIGSDETDFTEEDDARDRFGENTAYKNDPSDPSMRRVKKRYVWIKNDADEDGIAEMQYCIVVGEEILYREEVGRIPVAVLCCDPMPHRHHGLDIADATMDIQDIKTAVLRQGLDNLYLSNNTRVLADPGKVNLDDLVVNRPGGIVRTKGAIFGQDIAPLPVPFVFPQALEGLEYLDQVRENRTGTNRYFTGIDQNAMNKTATGIQQLSTMAAQRVEQIARVFAAGIEDMVSILHEIVLKSGHKKDVVRLRGQWVTVDPSTWKSRTDFRISVGFAAGNKDAMVSRLMMIAQAQEKGFQIGIVQPRNAYETAIELVKASDFAAPERFFTDPETMPPQPPQPDPLTEVEKIKADATLQAKQMDVAQRDRDLAATTDIEKYKTDVDAQTKLTIEQMRLSRDIESSQENRAHAAEMEGVKAAYNPKNLEVENNAKAKEGEQSMLQQLLAANAEQTQQMQMLIQGVMQAISQLAAPREVVRGKDGKIMGSRISGLQ